MSVPFKALLTRSQRKENFLSGVLAARLQAVSKLIAYPIYIHYPGYEFYGTWLIQVGLNVLVVSGLLLIHRISVFAVCAATCWYRGCESLPS
jgi:hypothetical protein